MAAASLALGSAAFDSCPCAGCDHAELLSGCGRLCAGRGVQVRPEFPGPCRGVEGGRRRAEDGTRRLHFSNRLPDEAVTEQKAIRPLLDVFRSQHLPEGGGPAPKSEDFEFSQNYLFFYDKLEKSNVFLEAVIRTRHLPSTDRGVEWLMRNTVQDGGNWLGFVELVKKYGVVPKDVMPETFSSSNSEGVDAVLALRLKVAAVKIRAAQNEAEIAVLRLQALKDAYRILALTSGSPRRSSGGGTRTRTRGSRRSRPTRRSSSTMRSSTTRWTTTWRCTRSPPSRSTGNTRSTWTRRSRTGPT